MAAFNLYEETLQQCQCRAVPPCRFFSVENDMDPGAVPQELQGLTEIEELLISRG